MNDIINVLIAVIFITAAIISKITERYAKKKASLPTAIHGPPNTFRKKKPIPLSQDIPAPKQEGYPDAPVPAAVPEKEGISPEAPPEPAGSPGISKEVLKRGIILSVILGPPKSRKIFHLH